MGCSTAGMSMHLLLHSGLGSGVTGYCWFVSFFLTKASLQREVQIHSSFLLSHLLPIFYTPGTQAWLQSVGEYAMSSRDGTHMVPDT